MFLMENIRNNQTVFVKISIMSGGFIKLFAPLFIQVFGLKLSSATNVIRTTLIFGSVKGDKLDSFLSPT